MYIFFLALTHIIEFERAITIRLYNLVTLQFALHFPIDIFLHDNETQRMASLAVLQNDAWQSRGWYVRDHFDTDQKIFVIYTIPYALSYDCSLRNHTFVAAQQPDFVDLKTHHPLLWTCTNPNPSMVAQSLKGLRQARYLHWTFESWVSLYSFLIKVDRLKILYIKFLFFELILTVFYCCKNLDVSIGGSFIKQYRFYPVMVHNATSFIMSFYEFTNTNRRSRKYDYTNAFCLFSSSYSGRILKRVGSMFATKTGGYITIIGSFTSLFRLC